MNSYMEDNLPRGLFVGLVLDKILVDAFKPKFGYEKDLAVFSFFVKQSDAANKLMSYIVQKNFDLLDIEVSPDPKIDGKYILFIEMNRNKDMFTTMDKLLLHIDYLVSIKQWYFKASATKEYMDWNRNNFVKVVPQTPDEYSNKEPVSGGHNEVDNVSQNSKDADINHSLLEEIIERQVAKFNQSYIKSLKEQIKSINENKLQLSQHIEDLKIDRKHLYKQLELSHNREKIALIREQQDFKRIKSLKNQLALLASPDSSEMKIVTPDKNAYDTNIKPVIGVIATEAEVKDEDKIYTEIQDEYKESSKGNQHSDETPALNESSTFSRLNDITAQSLLKESTSKTDDESYLADDPVPKYMVLGQEALKSKDYDNAIEYFLKVVDILPNAGTVLLNLADLYFLKKEYKAARKYAIQALELGEESATLVLDKIITVLAPNSGLPATEKSGKEFSEDVISLEEGYKEGSEELEDTIFIEQAAFNEAADSTENTTPDSIEHAVSKDDDEKVDQKKDDAKKYMSLGVEAAGQKDYHKAIEHFSKAVEILPDSAAGFCNIAVLNYRLKEFEPAYRFAQKAIDLGSPSASLILGKIKPMMIADLKSPAGFEPAADIDKIKPPQVAKEDEAFFIESDAVALDEFLKTEKQNQSDLAVDSSLRENDTVVNNIFKLGLAALEKKEFRKAIGHFTKVTKLLPKGIPSYIHLTKIHYSLGEYPQARKHAEKAFNMGDYTLKPILEKIDAKLAKEAAHPSTGSMGLKEQTPPAETVEGTEEDPEVPESYADAKPDKKTVGYKPEPKIMVEMPDVEFVEPIALAEAADSRENTAATSIENAASKDDDAKKYMALGVEATVKKDYQKAIEHFSKAVEIIPDNAVGFFNLAILHYHLEDYNTACKHAEKALNLGLHSSQSILERIKSKITTISKMPPAK